MMSKGVMGGGAILVGILIALTTYMEWPDYLQYIWAVLVLLWGVLWLKG
jgi:UDP-N-acetylmuramyl pentapeptide phosphotransferase/UDP-N-acetylglucosamine-1-phosphate transferase